MSLYSTIPIEKILRATAKELMHEITGDQYLVKEIVESLRSEIANDLGGLFDIFVQTMTPGNLVDSGNDNISLNESIIEGLQDWISEIITSEIITSAEESSNGMIDAFGSTMVIAHEIYEAIWPLIKQEIRNQISK